MRMHHVGLLACGFFVGVLGARAGAQEQGQEEAGGAAGAEYEPAVPMRQVLHEDLTTVEGKQGGVVDAELPPGWVGEKHYHTGDVFLYVQDGSVVVDVEGEGRKTFGPGEVYHEAVNKVMQPRNGSSDEPARILIFHVGEKGQPMAIRAE